MFNKILIAILLLSSFQASANRERNLKQQKLNTCLLEQIKSSAENTQISALLELCEQLVSADKDDGALTERLNAERKNKFNPYTITPHRMNYILPISYISSYNEAAYQASQLVDPKQDLEAKFQISFKVPLNAESLFTQGDALYFGMTLKSWWQVYGNEISKPFRETNYQPEVFYYLPVKWQIWHTETSLAFGLEHQSNGREAHLSRSWNRAYMSILVEDADWLINLRPWWRLPESDKKSEDDPNGDDNPDISKYMGYFELTGAYRVDHKIQGQFMLRQNLATGKGALELGFTYPIWGRLRGYMQFFTGYGESLIDYNHSQQRFGLGIALTDRL